jgi:hypothetical protein
MRTARGTAVRLMRQHAPSPQAKAMVGVRFDATEVTPGVTEVWCDGSAVVATPVVDVTAWVDRDPRPTWDFGRVTRLGDAAPPMSPTGANGASHTHGQGRLCWVSRGATRQRLGYACYQGHAVISWAFERRIHDRFSILFRINHQSQGLLYVGGEFRRLTEASSPAVTCDGPCDRNARPIRPGVGL